MKEGYPCVFYGDYYSMKGEGSPHRPILDILLDARRSRAFGEQTDYFDHPNTVGFTRSGDAQHPDSGLALLLSNGDVTVLRTISSGRATSSMEFSHFEEVPANLAKEIIEKASGKRKDIE